MTTTSFNRTVVELKYSFVLVGFSTGFCFNRTVVELK